MLRTSFYSINIGIGVGRGQFALTLLLKRDVKSGAKRQDSYPLKRDVKSGAKRQDSLCEKRDSFPLKRC